MDRSPFLGFHLSGAQGTSQAARGHLTSSRGHLTSCKGAPHKLQGGTSQAQGGTSQAQGGTSQAARGHLTSCKGALHKLQGAPHKLQGASQLQGSTTYFWCVAIYPPASEDESKEPKKAMELGQMFSRKKQKRIVCQRQQCDTSRGR